MFCNLSVSESLLFLRRALAFSACTCFLDPMSLGRLQGYEGVARLQLEALRQALVGFAAAWQLASVQQYADVVLSLSQVVHLTPHHSMPLLISGTCEQGVERALYLKQFW